MTDYQMDPDAEHHVESALPHEHSIAITNISSQTNSNTNKIKVAEPDIFDGAVGNFRNWVRQVSIYLWAKEITSDKARILTTLSYMKKGTAAIWAQQHFNRHVDNITMGPWNDFVTKL
jgi:hypothetical protein